MTSDAATPWVRATDGGAVLDLAIQPGAKRSEVAGTHGDALKIRVAAPPVDGAANEALLLFLAAALGVKARAVTLVRGAASRRKAVRVEGLTPDEVVARLART